MRAKNNHIKPQDILLLLKLTVIEKNGWQQIVLAKELGMSQSEISQSLARCEYANFVSVKEKLVIKSALLEFIEHGLAYVFPQKPGPVTRGIATAHSYKPLNELIESSENYVWPYSKGNLRGHGVTPLYKSVPEACLKDTKLYELVALTEAIRVGKVREKKLAIDEFKKRLL